MQARAARGEPLFDASDPGGLPPGVSWCDRNRRWRARVYLRRRTVHLGLFATRDEAALAVRAAQAAWRK